MKWLDQLHFNDKGLIPTIIQDVSGKVLTLCYMNREAIQKTVQTGKIYVFRRSQNKLMLKGETSGHTQQVKEVFVDCEDNSLLFVVEQKVAACHAGYFTCYYRKVSPQGEVVTSEDKVFDPKKVY
jgi:phosphoribosyl-AMP cyclohydrolase